MQYPSTYQRQAEFMARKHGVIQALDEARRFARISDEESRYFWQRVVMWLERFAVQAAAMHELD